MKGRWNLLGQLSLEVNLIETGLKGTTLNIEDSVLIFKELLAVLALLVALLETSLIAILHSFLPVTMERALLSTFDLELDMGALDCLCNVEIDHTADCVTWLVEWVLSLQLDLTLGEFTPLV